MKLYLATDSALAILSSRENDYQCELRMEEHQPQCVVVDPLRLELVYCGTMDQGLWRSDDAGRSWRKAGNGIVHQRVLSVAVSPLQRVNGRGVVYVGTEPSAVFRSEDGGETWRNCVGLSKLPSSNEWSFPPRPDTHHARWIHPDAHVEGRLYVAIEAGALIRSTDGGGTWTDRVPTGPIDTHQLVTHLSTPGRLYSAAGDGYFESLDFGDSWQQLEEELEHRYAWSVAVDSADPECRIISSAASPQRSHFKADAESFIYRRTANSQWQQVNVGLPNPSGRRTAVLAAHPSEPHNFFTVWESDLFRSIDGGESWQQLDVNWPDDFKVNEPRGLAVAPS
ncbi:hypothetical protein [Novipirellula rosea]|uniref:Glycosyl hydrolase n=1 Tax=Novipirellula rosea TaxID=1031540 RepID=A0ABP8NLU4_9BACT